MARPKKTDSENQGIGRVSVDMEKAFVRLYDAAHRTRHMKPYIAAMGRPSGGGVFFHESFHELAAAIEDAAPFADQLRETDEKEPS